VLVAFLWFRQESMLFLPGMPSRAARGDTRRHRPGLRGAAHRTADGEELDAWFVPARRERAVLLFFHGNAGNISHRLDSLRIFHGLGLSVLIIDYRGYGRSTGRPTEQGTYEDARAAWRHLVEERGVPPERIVVFGRSLGGAVAAWLAARTRPAGLIVESAFRSVPSLRPRLYWFLPVRRLARSSTRWSAARPVQAPVLVVHSREDEIIPFRHGEALFAAAVRGPAAAGAGAATTTPASCAARPRRLPIRRGGLEAFLQPRQPTALKPLLRAAPTTAPTSRARARGYNSIPSAQAKKLYSSANSSISIQRGLAPPEACPARVSTRSRTGRSQPWACCSAAANL
jgi:uncharacterized protein